MSILRSLSVLALAVLVVAGCTRHATPTPIEGLEVVKDNVRQFEVKVPSNWIKQTQPGDLIIAFSKPRISRRFLDFSPGDGGAKVELRAIPMDSSRTMESLIKNSKLQFEDGLDRYKLENATLGGKPAKKLHVRFDQEDGEFRSEAYFAENDSVITILTFAAFGRTFEDYEKDFNEILASVKLARRPDVPKQQPDTLKPTGPEPPSDTLRTYSAPDFTIQIPQNFEGKRLGGPALSSINFFGSRLDCNVQIDVFDASKQKNLEKILAQNKPNYGGKDPTGVTINGQKGAYFSYTPSANINSRAYFVVKDNKLYRLTVNWFKPEEKVYLPLFEKCIATLALK